MSSASETKNAGNVAGGFKATVHNPKVSEEARQHAQERLSEMGTDADAPARSSSNQGEKNEGNVIGGFKATLKNPRVSNEAKEHAKEELHERGVEI